VIADPNRAEFPYSLEVQRRVPGDQPSAERSVYRQDDESLQGERDTPPRTWGRRGASKLASFAGFVVGEGFGDETAELPSLEIGFNLFVPNARVKLQEPRPELRKLFWREILNPVFQLLDFAHAILRNKKTISQNFFCQPALKIPHALWRQRRRSRANFKRKSR